MNGDTIRHAPEQFSTLTCLANAPAGDDLVERIKADLAGKGSVLELVKEYMTDLRGECDNDALPFRKLHRLFQLGATPAGLAGHHFGVAVGLRSGGLRGVAAEYGNLLGFVWGTAISGVCPWVGKSFTPMTTEDPARSAIESVAAGVTVRRGFNHFHLIKDAPVNVAANALLLFMWHLKTASDVERAQYGHERNGGHFAGYRAPSVYSQTPREVFLLNYRFPQLGNAPPLSYLIDELVEIADGLYLGELIYATDLLREWDPSVAAGMYQYRLFGYFLLMDEEWHALRLRIGFDLDNI